MSLYKEDVYETEDPPNAEPIETVEKFESEEVEKVHMSMGAAKKRFDHCLLDSEGADFSDSVGVRRLKRGFKASEVFESETIGSEEEETLEQKFNRLNREIRNLAAEVEQSQNESPSVKKEDVVALDELLKTIASNCKKEGRQPISHGRSEESK
ncbi:hypothetical protein niasHS_002241 [Heterodera schachtii]